MRMHLAAVSLLAFALAACAADSAKPTSGALDSSRTPAQATFSGGDGLSCDNAVKVHAKSSMQGIRMEYEWIRDKYPGYTKSQQALLEIKGRMYDLITIEKVGAKRVDVCFDITQFFGEL